MHTPLPLTRDLVLIGGGHAHALVLRKWGMNPLPGVRATLITPGPTAAYSGMLPGHIAGHYSREDLEIDLVRLARFAGARLVLAPATRIDPERRIVEVAGRAPVAYDVATIDVGIHAEMPGIPGFDEHALGAKPLDVYAARWRAFLTAVERREEAPRVAVIGGGIAGVELALAMAHAMRNAVGRAEVTIIEAENHLTGAAPSTRRRLARAMDRFGVTLRTGVAAQRVTAEAVTLSDGSQVPARLVIGAAGAFAHDWLAHSPLPLTRDGFIITGPDLRVDGHDNLFAVGDCAHMPHAPRPKAGVYAVRAAPVLYDNLLAVLAGGPMRPFHPQRDFLKLVSLGDKSALAEKWGRALAGPVLWRWKNRIDTKFMDKFRTLPKMPVAPLPARVALGVAEELEGADKPLCGGCGSKVSPGALAGALSGLPRTGRDDVLTGPGDDAAIMQMGGVRQVLTTDHLRAFTNDHGLLARIAALHALGDVWAMGAKPQAALVSVILPRMSPALQQRSMDEIMQGAADVLGDAGAAIAGGHSTMGSELTIGFTITGLCEGDPVTLSGARPGDALILTRPIGTGTLLAAEMQGRADGRDIAGLFAEMQRPQDRAAEILQPHAHAMTDVTGFGLAGHLTGICRASDTGAMLDLAAVPIYPGALDLAAAGHHSTIHAANRDAAPVSAAPSGNDPALQARLSLLHDPQTAGGLLAAVAVEHTAGLVDDLRRAGYAAAVIGEVTDGPVSITCR